jgi:hypothetical protein
MLTFKSSKNSSMSDIPISFDELNLGSTITKVAGEVAVYHRDAAAIFGLLKVPVKFIDVNGKELAVDGSGSGIYF